MKFLSDDDTIVALSTPLGKGAIAIVRVSGKKSLEVVNPLLKRTISFSEPRVAHFNEIHHLQTHATIDQVVTTYFRAPHSYTGEDVVEISCHCNPLIINSIIQNIVESGARIAEPGEFTFRGFMKGKMDLSQAEAVAEVINSRSRQSLTQAIRHLEGKLSEKIMEIRKRILDDLSLLEINLDFSEEDIEALPLDELGKKTEETIGQIESLLRTYDYGKLLQEGIKLLILGKPNVGKSSLLNTLLRKERAIVSDIPGTTRDYIEASMEIEGIALQAVDTAGIRKTDDPVEMAGIRRALEHLETADITLCVFEAHRPLDEDDRVLMEAVEQHRKEVKFVLVENKTDLGTNPQTTAELSRLNLPTIPISATLGAGIDELKTAIKEQLISDRSMETEEVVVTSIRHKEALENTVRSLQNALEAIKANATEEIIAVDFRLALDHLGKITGETTPEDVLNHIFANFCIGK